MDDSHANSIHQEVNTKRRSQEKFCELKNTILCISMWQRVITSTVVTQCVFNEAFPREYYCLNTAVFLMQLDSLSGLECYSITGQLNVPAASKKVNTDSLSYEQDLLNNYSYCSCS